MEVTSSVADAETRRLNLGTAPEYIRIPMPSITSVLDVAVIIVLASIYVAALTAGTVCHYAHEWAQRLVGGIDELASSERQSAPRDDRTHCPATTTNEEHTTRRSVS